MGRNRTLNRPTRNMPVRSALLRYLDRGPVRGVLVALAGTGHVLYPAFLHLRTRRLRDETPPQADRWVPLTVVVPAYREASVIAAKVRDLRANGYPGRLDVIVVADDAETAEAAAATGATVLGGGQRLGKATALNRGLEAADTEIVVVTDANAMLRPGSLAAMARWFEDPSVGAVAGEKRVPGSGEGVYWRFESWLKRREARTGSTFALVGELAAVRREAFRPLPPDLAVEDLWLALDVLEQGLRIVYEPNACAEEAESPDWAQDWERRTRVVSGVLDVLWRRRNLLSPSSGILAAQLWGHRLLRSTVGPVAHGLLVLTAMRAAPRSPSARVLVAAHIAGLVAAVRTQRRVPQSAPERVLGQVLLLQAIGLGGFSRFLRGDRPALWPKPDRAGPTPASAPSTRGVPPA